MQDKTEPPDAPESSGAQNAPESSSAARATALPEMSAEEEGSVVAAALKEYARLQELWVIVCMMILPYSIIWLGMNFFKSAVVSLALYHGFCLLPGIIWGKDTYKNHLRPPSFFQLLGLVVASILFSIIAVFAYLCFGDKVLSSPHVMELLRTVGYNVDVFWPISIYIVVVNPALEELFWRGFVMTRLDQLCPDFPYCGLFWSSFAYGAFHYPIMQLVMYPGWAEFGTIMLMAYGAFLGILYKRTEKILLVALAHALLTDLSAVILMLALFHRLNVH